MAQTLIDHFRCPASMGAIKLSGALSRGSGYFKFGRDLIAYGRTADGEPSPGLNGELRDIGRDDAWRHAIGGGNGIGRLPFDLDEIVQNYRFERYVDGKRRAGANGENGDFTRRLYYRVRPLFPVAADKHLRRFVLRGWRKLPFPRWPVDRSVEALLEQALITTAGVKGVDTIPFIWFWPKGYRSALIMTHDVETSEGRDFCPALMKLNERHGFRSAFQFVPEQRYETPKELRADIRERGHEVGVHGLNHDGRLFEDRDLFAERARKINQYAAEFAALGFRSPVLYRNADWIEDLDFSYDMSFPSIGHLDPQHGGCATCMPYFIGKMLELPLTTIQDYSLFHILGRYAIDLWREQIETIAGHHGLVSFNIHPDYLIASRAREVYRSLLAWLDLFCRTQRVWRALPREVDAWWRQRSRMQLAHNGSEWTIHGPGAERARVAFARIKDGEIVYKIGPENSAPRAGADVRSFAEASLSQSQYVKEEVA